MLRRVLLLLGKRWRPVLLLAFVIVLLAQGSSRPADGQGQTRLVLAFYYAWYHPGSFGPGKTPFQPITPYSSTDAGTIQRQVNEARAAGIDGFVQSWFGPNDVYTNGNFRTLLGIAEASGFKAAVDFEPAVYFGTHEERAAGIKTLLETHANHPAYLRVDGKPVIFFWANWLFSVQDWAYIRSLADPNNTSIWIAEGGNTEYLAVFDGLHLYNIAWSADPAGTAATWGANTRAAATTYGTFKYWVATASPGFDDRLLGRGDNSIYRDREGGAYYQRSFAGAAASNPDMLIITSYNEWAEGSNIEPSLEFGTTYLDMTAQMAGIFKAGGIPGAPALPQPTVDPAQPPPPGAQATAQPAPATVEASPMPLVSPTPNANGEMIYTAVAGDSIYGIAARFGLTADELYRLNNFTPDTVIKIGDPVIIGYGSVTVVPVPQGAAATSAAPLAGMRGDGAIMHVVVAGDTALGIAAKYDITLEEFYSLNGFTEETIFRPGDQLVVGYEFVPLSVGGSTDLPTPTAAPPTQPPPATAGPPMPTIPVVTAAVQFSTPAPANPGAMALAQPTKDVAKAVTGAGPTATPTPTVEDTTDTGNVGRMGNDHGGPNLLLPLAAGLIMLVVGMMGLALYRRQ